MVRLDRLAQQLAELLLLLAQERQGLGDPRAHGGALQVLELLPAAEETRANLHVGGQAEQAQLTRRDLEICEMIGPTLHERGLIFVGIDVIGEYLTEINVTSPTGLQEIDRFDGVNLEGRIWDAIEGRINRRTEHALPT